MPLFSVVVVCRNEATTLPKLVASLAVFRQRGGGIVVVDTGSQDGTPEVARRLGCRVEEAGDRFAAYLTHDDARSIQEHFGVDGEGPIVWAGQRVFNFAGARQFAASLAERDFVWQLDGSDEVLALDVDRVDARLGSGEVGGLSYRLRLQDGSFRAARFCDRRLYRWEGRTHEGLYPIPGMPAARIAPTVVCDETEISVVHHRQPKERSYLAGLALDAMAFPDAPRWKHYLGRELVYGGWYRSAIPVLESHATVADGFISEQAQSLCFAGECRERLGQFAQAEAAYQRASVLDRSQREPLLRLSALQNRHGHFAEAVESTLRALAVRTRGDVPESDANYSWLPHAHLCWALFWLGRKEEARHHWQMFKTLAPHRAHAYPHARLFADRNTAVRTRDVVAERDSEPNGACA